MLVYCQSPQGKLETVIDGNSEIYEESMPIPKTQRRDVSHEFRFIQIDDSVSIYLLRAGQGLPMILLNGGPGNSCHSFIPYFDRAADFCEIILYDPRGVGKSDWKPGIGYSNAQLISDLEKIRRKLGIDRWVLAGWSYGGLAAQHYYLQFPQRVLGLVLINSSYSTDYEFPDHSYPDHLTGDERERIREIYSIGGNKVVPAHSDEVDLETMQKMVFNGYLNGDWKRQFFYKPTREEMAAVARYEWYHDKNYNKLVTGDGFNEDLNGRFLASKLPVLLIYGRHDMTFSTQLGPKMKMEFPNSTLVMMEQSSHNPFKEEPEIFFSELEKFVKEIELDLHK